MGVQEEPGCLIVSITVARAAVAGGGGGGGGVGGGASLFLGQAICPMAKFEEYSEHFRHVIAPPTVGNSYLRLIQLAHGHHPIVFDREAPCIIARGKVTRFRTSFTKFR